MIYCWIDCVNQSGELFWSFNDLLKTVVIVCLVIRLWLFLGLLCCACVRLYGILIKT
ncbi:hypothetical protein ACIAD0006 [Acinetobacter baylyi ADP1]|uniref:Uncharacterized protein n=1 Tax=Acinetobacter baylyi (strain ATCC 33305 / BD413 / ADP1) TaxID=62977 RepID=Q6FG16_ACIAD|nr:hypothetical protein ACIAD0006 [Acinetobacter baylyi ADP1]